MQVPEAGGGGGDIHNHRHIFLKVKNTKYVIYIVHLVKDHFNNKNNSRLKLSVIWLVSDPISRKCQGITNFPLKIRPALSIAG